MDWLVRRATVDEADRLGLVGSATFLETFAGILCGDAIVAHCAREHSPAAYRRYLEAEHHGWLVEALPGHAPVGFALVGPTELPGSAADGSDLELKRIYAFSRFHGRGLGAALMREAVDHAVQQRCTRLLLGVYSGNTRARAFYAKSGFVQIAERRFRVGDRHYDDVVLARPIEGAGQR